MSRFVRSWLPVVAWCALIFYASSRPGSEVGPLLPAFAHVDKVAHAIVYAVLGWLARRAFAAHGLGDRAGLVAAIVFCVVYGASDELHQLLGGVGRDADPFDLLADTIGASLGAGLWQLKARRSAA